MAQRRRLSEGERVQLEQQRVELRLLMATLRSDEALRIQAAARPTDVRPRLHHGRWRDWVE
jgi:hypothetical protein